MKCFFHFYNGTDELLDETGVDVADANEARREALQAVAELRREQPRESRDWSGWELRAVDEAGAQLFSVTLTKDGFSQH